MKIERCSRCPAAVATAIDGMCNVCRDTGTREHTERHMLLAFMSGFMLAYEYAHTAPYKETMRTHDGREKIAARSFENDRYPNEFQELKGPS